MIENSVLKTFQEAKETIPVRTKKNQEATIPVHTKENVLWEQTILFRKNNV